MTTFMFLIFFKIKNQIFYIYYLLFLHNPYLHKHIIGYELHTGYQSHNGYQLHYGYQLHNGNALKAHN